MGEDADGDWVPPEAIYPGKQAKVLCLPPMMASFLKESVHVMEVGVGTSNAIFRPPHTPKANANSYGAKLP